jgi:sugar/nucleoside kinase (ribokinase family)
LYAPSDFPTNLLQPGGVLLASAYPLLPAWRPQGFAEVLAQARWAGMMTALDIGPAIGRPTALDELREMLPDVDYLLCNRHELAVCTGEETPAAGMAALAAAGAGCVVVKQGREGVSIRLPDGKSISVPGFVVEARFTVGAGDAFNAGFLFALKQGQSIMGAATFANAVAARVVSAARGALGAASLAEVEALLAPER